jgi:hypothetical protein
MVIYSAREQMISKVIYIEHMEELLLSASECTWS